MKKIIFVTGTDTGVGKTILTSLLLFHLRRSGVHALAMKPFCSGGRSDVRRLQALQRGELSDDEMNPFYFDQPLAPLAAGGKKQGEIRLENVVQRINNLAKKCDCLLVEGAGGLMVPLGEKFAVVDLITALKCRVIVVARNRLGTINHTLLTVNALRSCGLKAKQISVVLMDMRNPDLSAQTNPAILAQLLRPISLAKIPYLGPNAASSTNLQMRYPEVQAILEKV